MAGNADTLRREISHGGGNMLKYIILGVVQGLTEFLPVSSSGHLTIAEALFHLESPDANLTLDICLHLGTLLAVVWFLRAALLPYITVAGWKDAGRRRVAFLVFAASIPTAIIGLSLKDTFEKMFASPSLVCLFLAVTGVLLLLADSRKAMVSQPVLSELPLWKALLIGLFQGIAITPGISRSGSTIAGGMLLGIPGVEAARFSFLLSIPAVGGAALLQARKIMKAGLPADFAPSELMVGFLTSAAVGLLALKLLQFVLERQKLSVFAYYLFAASIIAFSILSLSGGPR